MGFTGRKKGAEARSCLGSLAFGELFLNDRATVLGNGRGGILVGVVKAGFTADGHIGTVLGNGDGGVVLIQNDDVLHGCKHVCHLIVDLVVFAAGVGVLGLRSEGLDGVGPQHDGGSGVLIERVLAAVIAVVRQLHDIGLQGIAVHSDHTLTAAVVEVTQPKDAGILALHVALAVGIVNDGAQHGGAIVEDLQVLGIDILVGVHYLDLQVAQVIDLAGVHLDVGGAALNHLEHVQHIVTNGEVGIPYVVALVVRGHIGEEVFHTQGLGVSLTHGLEVAVVVTVTVGEVPARYHDGVGGGGVVAVRAIEEITKHVVKADVVLTCGGAAILHEEGAVLQLQHVVVAPGAGLVGEAHAGEGGVSELGVGVIRRQQGLVDDVAGIGGGGRDDADAGLKERNALNGGVLVGSVGHVKGDLLCAVHEGAEDAVLHLVLGKNGITLVLQLRAVLLIGLHSSGGAVVVEFERALAHVHGAGNIHAVGTGEIHHPAAVLGQRPGEIAGNADNGLGALTHDAGCHHRVKERGGAAQRGVVETHDHQLGAVHLDAVLIGVQRLGEVHGGLPIQGTHQDLLLGLTLGIGAHLVVGALDGDQLLQRFTHLLGGYNGIVEAVGILLHIYSAGIRVGRIVVTVGIGDVKGSVQGNHLHVGDHGLGNRHGGAGAGITGEVAIGKELHSLQGQQRRGAYEDQLVVHDADGVAVTLDFGKQHGALLAGGLANQDLTLSYLGGGAGAGLEGGTGLGAQEGAEGRHLRLEGSGKIVVINQLIAVDVNIYHLGLAGGEKQYGAHQQAQAEEEG